MPHVVIERNPRRLLLWFAREFAKKNPSFHVDEASFAAVADSHPDLDGIPSILSDALLERAEAALGARLTFVDNTVRLNVGT
jgi:hypothetical protein